VLGGGTVTKHVGAPEPVDPDENHISDCCDEGDPINVGNGNKWEAKTEYVGNGPFPLTFS
jgi:hypothetical protein